MALTDIVFLAQNSAEADRGDVGTLVDITEDPMSNRLLLSVPLTTQVQSGVSYGQQGTELTGSYTGGAGGSGVSRGRVTNA